MYNKMNIEIRKSNRDGKKFKALIDGKKDYTFWSSGRFRLYEA